MFYIVCLLFSPVVAQPDKASDTLADWQLKDARAGLKTARHGV